MRSSANDIPLWLASLSDWTLLRLNSRLNHLLRMIDVELQARDPSIFELEVRATSSHQASIEAVKRPS